MKLYTVNQLNYMDGRLDDVLPFVTAFRSAEEAQQAIRLAFREDLEALYEGDEEGVPEDSQVYFSENGLEASDLNRFAAVDWSSDWTDWTITEVTLAD